MITGCSKKDSGIAGKATIQISGGGITNFPSASLRFISDSINYTNSVVISSSDVLKEDLTVTLDVDDAARLAYNSSGAGFMYDALPDSAYLFPTRSVTIKAGEKAGYFTIKFYRLKIDQTKNYMLPVTIKDVQGQTIVDSLKTIYFHTVGNSLTGTYADSGSKTEYAGADNTDPINNISSCPASKIIIAADSITSVLDYADLGSFGWQYIITYKKDTNEFDIVPNDVMNGPTGIQPGSFIIDEKSYDPLTNKIY